MDGDLRPQALLAAAADLPSLLAAAYETFEHILAALRSAEESAGAMLPAFVMAAAAAANGRDAILTAPSLPRAGPQPPPPPIGGTPLSIADHAATLGLLLESRLATAAAGSADEDAAGRAAGCARRIHQLLAPADDR